MSWRIYTDAGTFSSWEGSPEDAPGLGVVCIVQDDPDVGRMVMARWDHYCYSHGDGQWWGHDLFGLLDCLAHRRPSIIAHGRTVTAQEWQRIHALAVADPDFLPKSATHPIEMKSALR